MDDQPSRRDTRAAGQFPTTRWTLVQNAGNPLDEEQQAALNEVLNNYWPAMRAHLIMRRALNPHDADDLVQNFIKDRILERDFLATADRERGRFRSLLVKALENYLANEVRRRSAKKRAAERTVSFDEDSATVPSANSNTPDAAAESQAVRDTLQLVLDRMQRECVDNGHAAWWDLFDARIVAPIFHGAEPLPYEEIVQRFDYASTAQAQNALVSAKRMFSRIMRRTLCEKGISPNAIDDEIRSLEECLAGL